MNESATESHAGRAFLDLPVRHESVGHAEIAYRRIGHGDPLLLIHGWPLWGFTFRKVLPVLAEHFECTVVDLPGAGETRWTPATRFKFTDQAETLKHFVDKQGWNAYSILAHDTGATIARGLCLIDPHRVSRLVAINTEIPGHRPPWIRLYQALSHLPGNDAVFSLLLKSRAFTRSSMGFGGLFNDLTLMEGEFHQHVILPMIRSRQAMRGQRLYLQGIDWKFLDSLAERHQEMKMPVLLIWGEDDPTFPIEWARRMATQFTRCSGLVPVPGTKLLPHEEKPDVVGRAALEFLLKSQG